MNNNQLQAFKLELLKNGRDYITLTIDNKYIKELQELFTSDMVIYSQTGRETKAIFLCTAQEFEALTNG